MTKFLVMIFILASANISVMAADGPRCEDTLDSSKSNIVQFRRKTEYTYKNPIDAILANSIKYLEDLTDRITSDQLVKASTQNEIWRNYNDWHFFKNDVEDFSKSTESLEPNPQLLKEFHQRIALVEKLLEAKNVWNRITQSGRTLTPTGNQQIKDPLPAPMIETLKVRIEAVDQLRKSLSLVERFAADTQLAVFLDKASETLQTQIEFLQQLRTQYDISKLDVEQVQDMNSTVDMVLQFPVIPFLLSKLDASQDTNLKASAQKFRDLSRQAQIVFAIYKNPEARVLGIVKPSR